MQERGDEEKRELSSGKESSSMRIGGEVPLPQSFLFIVSCFAFHPALGQLEVALVRLLCHEVRPENLS